MNFFLRTLLVVIPLVIAVYVFFSQNSYERGEGRNDYSRTKRIKDFITPSSRLQQWVFASIVILILLYILGVVGAIYEKRPSKDLRLALSRFYEKAEKGEIVPDSVRKADDIMNVLPTFGDFALSGREVSSKAVVRLKYESRDPCFACSETMGILAIVDGAILDWYVIKDGINTVRIEEGGTPKVVEVYFDGKNQFHIVKESASRFEFL